MHRRAFLQTLGMTFVAASAYSFGESIQDVSKGSERTALLYGTRYGATEDTARWIVEGMDTSVDLLNIETVNIEQIAGKYDKFIIGSGIWIDGAHKKLMKLLASHTKEMEPKIIAAFIVCGTTGEDEAGRARIEGYFERFFKPLSIKPEIKRHFGGRMVIEKLSEKDRKILDNFYNKILKKKFVSWDRTEPKEAERFGKVLHAQTI